MISVFTKKNRKLMQVVFVAGKSLVQIHTPQVTNPKIIMETWKHNNMLFSSKLLVHSTSN